MTFSRESFLRSFYVLTIWVCNFFGKKILAQKLIIKYWWNWHQITPVETSEANLNAGGGNDLDESLDLSETRAQKKQWPIVEVGVSR